MGAYLLQQDVHLINSNDSINQQGLTLDSLEIQSNSNSPLAELACVAIFMK